MYGFGAILLTVFFVMIMLTYLHGLKFVFVAELHLPITYGILGQVGEPSGI